MKFPHPLIPGTLLKRYKRFLADILLDTGEEIVAHCPNTGAMLTLVDPGLRVWVSPKDGNLKYGWELVEQDGTLVGMNTMVPNRLVFEALTEKRIPELARYSSIRKEVKYGNENSKIDFLLESPALPPCYVEVKQVHLKRGTQAVFPDCVTERGAKHLREMAKEAQLGHRAVMLYVIQREDVESFSLAEDLDPNYVKEANFAKEAGVEFLSYKAEVTLEGITLKTAVPVRL